MAAEHCWLILIRSSRRPRVRENRPQLLLAAGSTMNTLTIKIGLLRHSDIPNAVSLSCAEGWNQNEGDWRRLLTYDPTGCFGAYSGEQLVGTVTTTSYGAELAWVGMMLVDCAWRGRGIGKLLMTAALEYLRAAGVQAVKLDATPVGQPLYEGLGFKPENIIERWERPVPNAGQKGSQRLAATDISLIRAVDLLAFGCDRVRLIDMLIAERCAASVIQHAPSKRGYALARKGARAAYVGPLVATDRRTAACLLGAVLEQLSGPVYVDFNTRSGPSTFIAAAGFTRQRTLTRMTYGSSCSTGMSELVFAIAGPELG